MKKILSLFFATIICLSAFSAVFGLASAAPVDTSAKADLTIILTPDGVPVKGAEFKLYRIADISRSGKVTLTPPFSEYSIIFKTHDAASLRSLALTMKGYVLSNNITPDYTGVTDSNGKIKFSNIPLGMYLVVGSPIAVGNKLHVPEAFIVTLPAEAENENWEYDVSVRTKTFMGAPGQRVNLRVLKVWNDNGDVTARPQKVTIELYLGNRLYDTVELSKENNWHHTWYDLVGLDWSIVEKDVPSGYKVSVERDGTSFIVTNTKDDEPTNPDPDNTTSPDVTKPDHSNPPSTNPSGSDPSKPDPPSTNPSGSDPSKPDPSSTDPSGSTPSKPNPSLTDPSGSNPSKPNPSFTNPSGSSPSSPNPSFSYPSGSKPPFGGHDSPEYPGNEISSTDKNGGVIVPPPSGEGTDKPNLPQTGMLWWPVPILSMSGIIAIMLGWKIRRRDEDEA